MKNSQFLKQRRTCLVLRCASRKALVFESELPAGDTPMACHLRELEKALLAHAEREYLPLAAEELAALAGVGKGYDFAPHRLKLGARAQLAHGRVRVALSLQYTGKAGAQFVQCARQTWSACGKWRLR